MSCHWVKAIRYEEVVLTFWGFLKSWVRWPARCTSCRAAQTPRNHRSGRCWGAGAPSASRPPPWSAAAPPWSACGPESKRHIIKNNGMNMSVCYLTVHTHDCALTPAATRWCRQYRVAAVLRQHPKPWLYKTHFYCICHTSPVWRPEWTRQKSNSLGSITGTDTAIDLSLCSALLQRVSYQI